MHFIQETRKLEKETPEGVSIRLLKIGDRFYSFLDSSLTISTSGPLSSSLRI